METINKIEALLKRKGISGAQMSRDLGFSSGLFSQWRNRAQQPSIEKLQKIADYLDVSINELLRDEMPYNELAKSQNEAYEISEYILNNPNIEKDSKVGLIVNGYKFQGLIHDLIRGLLEKDEKEKDWLILTVQRLLELDKKYELTFNQLDDILFVIDSISSALSTEDPETFEHITNVIKTKLEKVGQEIRKD